MTENKKKLIDTGYRLFWKFGIRKVTVEEICREASLSKMTFYKYFRNKNDLVIAILNKISDEAVRDYADIMDQKIPFTKKVCQTIQLKIDQTENISKEFYDDIRSESNPDIKDYFETMTAKNLEMVMTDYIRAQKNGDIRQDINPKFIMYFLNHIMDMAGDKHLQSIYETPQALIMELVNFFFYGILPRPERDDG